MTATDVQAERVPDDGPQPDISARLAFLSEQIGLLRRYEYVAASSPKVPYVVVEVARGGDDALRLKVDAPIVGASFLGEHAEALRRLGFTPEASTPAWVCTPPSAEAPAAATLLEAVLHEIVGVDDGAVDVRHGSHEAEHEAEVKLAALRARVEPLLAQILGQPPAKDPDGDYVFDTDTTRVFVAPRAAPGLPVILRIFAITNLSVPITPELGLFLANLNFTLAFGRFALDVEHEAVWFSETLLGEQFTDGELEFMVRMVAATAAEWDDRIAEMFGGFTRATAPAGPVSEPPASKPGEGGYL